MHLLMLILLFVVLALHENQVENPAELDELLDEAAYKEHCENEDH